MSAVAKVGLCVTFGAGVSLGVGVDVSEEMIKHAQQFSSLNSQYLFPLPNPTLKGLFSCHQHREPILSYGPRASRNGIGYESGWKIGIMVDLFKKTPAVMPS